MAVIDLARERNLRGYAREARAIDSEVTRLLLSKDSAAAEEFAWILVSRAKAGLKERPQANGEVEAARSRLMQRRIAAARFVQLALVE